MLITCPQCEKQYRFDEARFGQASTKRLKCPNCANVFDVTNPRHEAGDATNIGARSAGTTGPESKTDEVKLEPEAPELPQLAPLPRDMRFSLAVIAGSQAGTVFPLTKPRVYLGRGSSADVQIKDAEVSRRHAMLEIRGDEASLVDLGATNGTFVGGQRIDRVEIGNQSEFTLGSTTLMLIVTHSREVSI